MLLCIGMGHCFTLQSKFQITICFILLWLLAANHAFADTSSISTHPPIQSIYFPELKTISPNADDSFSFVLPFSRSGGLIVVKAKVDSTEGNFILDTGCPGLVLNITYFRNYPRTAEADTENDGIAGNVGMAEHTTVPRVQFGAMLQQQVRADLVSLANIENNKGIRILGLIGMRFLRNCEMIIDFDKNVILFHVIGKKEAGKYQHPMLKDIGSYNSIPFELTENRIMIKTVFEGKKLRLLIDCAAETNIMDSKLPDKILENISITGTVLLTGVGNKKVEAVRGSMSDFTVADRKMQNMPVIITNLEKTCFSMGGCVDGVLGFDFLSVKKIGFNFITRKMYLWK